MFCNCSVVLHNMLIRGINQSIAIPSSLIRVNGNNVFILTCTDSHLYNVNLTSYPLFNSSMIECLILTDSTFENFARNSSACILYHVSATHSITLTGLTFIRWSCTSGNGGAIYSSTEFTLTNTLFTSCTDTSGGVIYLPVDNKNASIESSTFMNCQAKNGGGIYWNLHITAFIVCHYTVLFSSLLGRQ